MTAPRTVSIAPWTFADVFDRPGSVRAMAILRLVLGPAVLLHLWPFLTDAVAGETFRDRFWEPWFPVLATPPGWVQLVLVWVGAAAAIGMGLGWRTRWTSWLTTACVAGNLLLSQTHFRHNRAFLVVLLVTVALSESGRVLSLDARRRRRRRPQSDVTTIWPMWLLRVLASMVYLASGVSKLVDPDWVGGLVLWDRAVRHAHLVSTRVPEPIAGWVVDVVTLRWVHTITSPLAVAMEIFIGIGLWFRRTRIAAVWVALVFHVSIQVAASVEVFSVVAIAALVVWATPATRDRSVTIDPTTSAARWIRRLDWLARFEIRHVPGATLTVSDRDGSTRSGREAGWMVCSRLPLTFPVAAPRQRFR